jgi:integral membrane protein
MILYAFKVQKTDQLLQADGIGRNVRNGRIFELHFWEQKQHVLPFFKNVQMNISISSMRRIALAEGVSFILLLGIGMPLKTIEIFWPNKVLGMTHGILFLVYVACAWQFTRENNWSLKNTLILISASFIPLAPFWVERKLLRDND